MQYIDSDDKLLLAVKEWQEHEKVAVDLECENNLHRFGSHIALIQVTTPKKDYIVDYPTLTNVQPLKEFFADSNVEKIFHDANFDLLMITTRIGELNNLFDTQIAAVLLGKQELGLGAMLESYYDIKKVSKFQKANWLKRPLTKGMLDYAIGDTKYLINLRDQLESELKEKGRMEWFKEECKILENKEFEEQSFSMWDVKGVGLLTDHERAVFKKLFDLRLHLAKKVDRPVHYIMPTKKLLALAKLSSKEINQSHLRQVHPIVKKSLHLFKQAIEDAIGKGIKYEKKPRMFFTEHQKEKMHSLERLRKLHAARLGVEPHVVASKDQIKNIVITGSYDSLHNWQKEFMKE